MREVIAILDNAWRLTSADIDAALLRNKIMPGGSVA